jgi:hypothetical protein
VDAIFQSIIRVFRLARGAVGNAGIFGVRYALVANTAVEQRLLRLLLLQLGVWVLHKQGAGRQKRIQYVCRFAAKRDIYRTGLRYRDTLRRKRM